MATIIPTTIKDRLPDDYHLPSQPLYYCEEDDTLFTSRSAASYHYHKCLVSKAGRVLANARQSAENEWWKVRMLKATSLPEKQKKLNGINARLRELLSTKDWKATHPTHAAKRREILELRYRRMLIIGELQKEIRKLDCARSAYRSAKDAIEYAEKSLIATKKRAEEAEAYWKEHNEKDKV